MTAVIRVERYDYTPVSPNSVHSNGHSNGGEHPQAHIAQSGNDATAESILGFMEKRLPVTRLRGDCVYRCHPQGKILRRMLKD